MVERLVCYCHTFMTTRGFVFIAPCSKHGEEEAFNAVHYNRSARGQPTSGSWYGWCPPGYGVYPQPRRSHTTAVALLASAAGQGTPNTPSGAGTPYAPSATRTAMSWLLAVSMCGSKGPASRPFPPFLLRELPAAGAQCLFSHQFSSLSAAYLGLPVPRQFENPCAAGECQDLLCASGYRDVGSAQLQQSHYNPFICQKRSSCAINYRCAQERFPLKSMQWLGDLKL